MTTAADILLDLSAEQDALDAVVAPLSAADWDLPTASDRWTITDQIGHLTFFDDTAALAITEPDAFAAHRDQLFAQFSDPEAVDEATLSSFRALAPADRLTRWREARSRLAAAGASLDDDTRVIWYGPSMSARSFLTARLMEAWAHGHDVVDALENTGTDSTPWLPTDRLRHIAQLGVITRGWSYQNRGEPIPESEVAVILDAPSGATWTWGADDAEQRISGPAVDFCRVVTQRRHVDDTDLDVVGADARGWMERAQAFAGGPTDGPPPGAHPRNRSAADG